MCFHFYLIDMIAGGLVFVMAIALLAVSILSYHSVVVFVLLALAELLSIGATLYRLIQSLKLAQARKRAIITPCAVVSVDREHLIREKVRVIANSREVEITPVLAWRTYSVYVDHFAWRINRCAQIDGKYYLLIDKADDLE